MENFTEPLSRCACNSNLITAFKWEILQLQKKYKYTSIYLQNMEFYRYERYYAILFLVISMSNIVIL